MEYYYIQGGDVVISDEELNSENYLIGETYDDYIHGAYVKLNDKQIEFYKNNKLSNPTNIFYMNSEETRPTMIYTKDVEALRYKTSNLDYVIVNGQKIQILNWKDLLFKVDMYEQSGREFCTLDIEDRFFKVPIQEAKRILNQIGVYEFEVNLVAETHIRHLIANPNDSNYDFTTGYPEMPSFEMEEVIFEMALNYQQQLDAVIYKKLLESEEAFNASKHFLLEENSLWIDSERRAALKESTTLLLSSGVETTTLWEGTEKYEISCSNLLKIINDLELYSQECFNVYQEHNKNIKELQNKEDINQYDCTTGYPEILKYSL